MCPDDVGLSTGRGPDGLGWAWGEVETPEGPDQAHWGRAPDT